MIDKSQVDGAEESKEREKVEGILVFWGDLEVYSKLLLLMFSLTSSVYLGNFSSKAHK